MQINFTYDSSVNNAPSGFKPALATAAAYLDSLIITPITVTMQVGWQEINGTAFSGNEIGAGGPSNGTVVDYAQLRDALAANASSEADATALANLPANSPINGGFFVTSAQEKALGLLDPGNSGIDGVVSFGGPFTFNFDPNNRSVPGQIDFIGAAEHELTHALGRFSGIGQSLYSTLDLFRFSSPGARQLSPGASYFSIDGGSTNLNPYDTTSDTSDWASSVTGDAFDASTHAGVADVVTQSDITEMDVLGFTMASSPLPAGISGTHPDLVTTDQSPVVPFYGVTISDQDLGQTVTLTVNVVSPANGILTNLGGGSYDPGTGIYTISGSLAAVNAAVRGLQFVPTLQQVAPGGSVVTRFILRVGNATGGTAADMTTQVTATALNYPPSLVTVSSGTGLVTSFNMDSRANAALLQPLFNNISTGVGAGTILSGSPGAAPNIPAGKSGLLLVSDAGQVTMPDGYVTALVGAAGPVTLTGGTSNGQLVAAQANGFTFNAGSGAGSVFAAGGNNSVLVDNGGGSQFIALGNGNDTINVVGGNNTISGGNGSNLIFLGAGQNVVKTMGMDTVVTGTGNATVSANGARSLVFGNFGNTPGRLNVLLGGANVTVSAANSATFVTSAAANGMVLGGFGTTSGGLSELDTGIATTVYAGNFGMSATLNGADALLYGDFTNTPGALSLSDEGIADTISAASSAITATLSGSQALLFGGYGNIAGALNVTDRGFADTIAAGNSATTVTGGATGGRLWVFGGTNTLDYVGGAGTATVLAGPGASSITGGAGGTTLFGSAGSSIVLGGNNGVIFAAGAGNETLSGLGSSGGNLLAAGPGANVIMGGQGSDTIFAGGGPDTLAGGGGTNVYSFIAGRTQGSSDAILDFNANDVLYLTGYGTNDAQTALSNASSTNGNTVITLTDHTQITFINVGSASQLQGHVFSF